ncbi:AcrR family transcriptional regulator [Rhodoligotrophos appendicifer]|uniref:TetR/AcrR family transcriptional regulator n=1 Tax=Rhodoligotrophos appendicifer TaxID=987056 RepID=UPI00117FE1EC|nr:TetR/AcrR family transcriptional regulator [Rhodoligotrophos appendicifer]
MSESAAILPTEREVDTRGRLIEAALRVFSNRGIDAATLREITEEAGANIAAVNYYFRSKDELTRSVLEHCLRPINEARLAALHACIERSAGEAVAIDDIVDALVRPMVEHSIDRLGGRAAVRLLLQVRALPRPLTNTILAEQFDQLHRLFLEALGKSLPHLSAPEIALRYDFARGAMMQILGDLDPAARDLPGLAVSHSGLDDARVICHLRRFISEGFKAPSAEDRTSDRPSARART